MKLILKHHFLGVVALVFCVTIGMGQQLSESQVPTNLQSHLYNYYPGAEAVEWGIAASKAGDKLYEANFLHESNKVRALFTNRGKRVYEDIAYTKKNSPSQLIEHADENYSKYKLVSVHKHTNFASGTRGTNAINYELVVKVGKEQTTVWFDEGMFRQDQFKTSNLAIK